ncbi:MAG: twin transrane helix small protein, partial [Rhizobacter sp.]|nr:twin transrane helix small protein [Rhizobacter sp.]
IFAALAAAGVFMMRGGGEPGAKSKNMAWALTVRIGVSVLLFVVILLSWKFGWISPHGIAAGQ